MRPRDTVVQLVTIITGSVLSNISVQLLCRFSPRHLCICTVLRCKHILINEVRICVLCFWERVHYHVVVKSLILVNHLNSIQLILHLSLEVSPLLLVLPFLLHAVDHHAGDQGADRNHSTEGANQHHIGVAWLGGFGPDVIVFGIYRPVRQDLANCPAVPRQADAGKGVVSILAESSVEARVWVTLVHLLRAVFASESREAGAGEVIHSVGAGSAVCARSVLAVVVVLFAVTPNEPILTDTLVVVDELEADPIVLAGAGDAVVDHVLTVSTLEAIWAHASVAGGVAVAGGLVLARVVSRADVEVRRELAMGAVEPSGAGTSVIILDPGLKQSKFMRILGPAARPVRRLADI